MKLPQQSDFIKCCLQYLDKVGSEENLRKIDMAADLCCNTINNNGYINIFGVGHSLGFAMEMMNSQNGTLPIRMLQSIDLVLSESVSIEAYNNRNKKFVQQDDMADKLLALHRFTANDVFILVSNSGINKMMIDFAQRIKKNGYRIIVVTSLNHTNSVESRHPSKKKLKDYGDIVIDNSGPLGDTLIKLSGRNKICSISSITSAVIAQMLSAQIQRELEAG